MEERRNAKRAAVIGAVLLILAVAAAIAAASFGRGKEPSGPAAGVTDYSAAENWAWFAEGENRDADVFLVCPTVDMRDEYNMRMDDEKTRASFLGALNMERGIYEESTRMFAPYYRQAAMKVYSLTPEEWEVIADEPAEEQG